MSSGKGQQQNGEKVWSSSDDLIKEVRNNIIWDFSFYLEVQIEIYLVFRLFGPVARAFQVPNPK